VAGRRPGCNPKPAQNVDSYLSLLVAAPESRIFAAR
jgi:hypothetical protein